jgi:hypothetical protein
MRKSSILLISIFIIVVLWASWPPHLAIIVIGIPAFLVIIWGAKKSTTPLFAYMAQDLEDARQNCTHKQRQAEFCFIAIFSIYFLLLMVPDSFWLEAGVRIPEKDKLPGIVWKMIERSSFPVSIYILWRAAPFLMFLMSCVVCYSSVFISLGSPEYARFLVIRARTVERGYWNDALIMGPLLTIVMPLWIALDPNSFDSPNTVEKILNLYHNKLSFVIFFGLIFLPPLTIAMLVNECRFRLFHMKHRRM